MFVYYRYNYTLFYDQKEIRNQNMNVSDNYEHNTANNYASFMVNTNI